MANPKRYAGLGVGHWKPRAKAWRVRVGVRGGDMRVCCEKWALVGVRGRLMGGA